MSREYNLWNVISKADFKVYLVILQMRKLRPSEDDRFDGIYPIT
jgi:hypothetical protein